MHRNRDQKKTQTLQQIQRKHYKVEVNNIQFLKINMSKYESSRNTQPVHVNSFMLAKAYWQLNFFKKINMTTLTTCFVPVEIISTTIDGPPGGPYSARLRTPSEVAFAWVWAVAVGSAPGWGKGENYYHIWISPLDLSDGGYASHFGVVHIDRT